MTILAEPPGRPTASIWLYAARGLIPGCWSGTSILMIRKSSVFTGNRDLRLAVDRTIRRFWINRCEKRSRRKGIGGLTDPRADLLRFAGPDMADADIINIHKTEHFVDLPSLAGIPARRKPVVFTLHDLSPITGGCDYPGSCERFTKSCGSCPVLNSGHRENDYSRKIFQMRQAAYGTRFPEEFALVANSRWTLEKARRSGLTAGRRAELIHYGLDQSIYQPENRGIARVKLWGSARTNR
jgi:hypothetical protein